MGNPQGDSAADAADLLSRLRQQRSVLGFEDDDPLTAVAALADIACAGLDALAWRTGQGGVEGTSSYGAGGLACYLATCGVEMIEMIEASRRMW